MNERIKELVKLAGIDDDMYPIDEWDNPELEKFAQLIIKECVKICSDIEADTEMPGLSDGALVCMVEIKEHFGVEE